MISDRLEPIFIPAVEHWVTTVDVHWIYGLQIIYVPSTISK